MISFIPFQEGGYQSRIKIENNRYLLLVNTTWFFPATKKDLTHLLKVLYHNDTSIPYQLDNVISAIISDLINDFAYNTESEKKRILKNIEQMKIFNDLYGGK